MAPRATESYYKFLLQFYAENYEEIFFYNITAENIPNRKPKFVNTSHKHTCRFCGRDNSKTNFKHKAHAIPEFLGNRLLRSYNECDECNTFFGKTYEDSGSKYFLLNATITGVKGKNGIPEYNTKKIPFFIRNESNLGTTIALERNNPSIEIWPLRQMVSIRWLRQPYVPNHLHKLFAKIAISVMPESELKNFSDTIYWVRNPTHDLRHTVQYNSMALKSDAMINCQYSFISLLRRKTKNVSFPYLLFLMQHAGTVFLTFIPTIFKDTSKSSITMYPFPIEPNFVLPIIQNLNQRTKILLDTGTSAYEYRDFLVANEIFTKGFLQVRYY